MESHSGYSDGLEGIVKGVILAGGLAKRLRPLSHTGPKQLVPIANRPALYYVIGSMVEAGVKDIAVVVSHIEENVTAIRNAVGDGSRWACRVTYIQQDAPRGVGHAVGLCREFIGGERFVVYLGDNILKEGIIRFVQEFCKGEADATLLVAEVDDPTQYGVAVFNEGGELMDVEEKPRHPRSNLAIIGVYMFTPAIFQMIDLVIPEARGELQITDAIRIMLGSKKYKVLAHRIEGWWGDTGTFEAVLNANRVILSELSREILGEVAEGATVMGHVKIGRGTRILPGSLIEGPTIIGEDCTIGPNSYVGSYTSVGDNVIIEGGQIEGSVICSNVKITHNWRITESIIGEFSEITFESHHAKGDRLILGSYSRVTRFT